MDQKTTGRAVRERRTRTAERRRVATDCSRKIAAAREPQSGYGVGVVPWRIASEVRHAVRCTRWGEVRRPRAGCSTPLLRAAGRTHLPTQAAARPGEYQGNSGERGRVPAVCSPGLAAPPASGAASSRVVFLALPSPARSISDGPLSGTATGTALYHR